MTKKYIAELEAVRDVVQPALDWHKKNIKKWGHQPMSILLPVLMEETGEVAEAYLGTLGCGKRKDSVKNLLLEIDQTIAVLIEMREQTVKHGGD